jgi:hypothetical protein
MTDRRPTAQESGDALCAEWGRAYEAVYGRAPALMVYRGGWFRLAQIYLGAANASRRQGVLAMTDRLWSLARENAEMKDSK